MEKAGKHPRSRGIPDKFTSGKRSGVDPPDRPFVSDIGAEEAPGFPHA